MLSFLNFLKIVRWTFALFPPSSCRAEICHLITMLPTFGQFPFPRCRRRNRSLINPQSTRTPSKYRPSYLQAIRKCKACTKAFPYRTQLPKLLERFLISPTYSGLHRHENWIVCPLLEQKEFTELQYGYFCNFEFILHCFEFIVAFVLQLRQLDVGEYSRYSRSSKFAGNILDAGGICNRSSRRNINGFFAA